MKIDVKQEASAETVITELTWERVFLNVKIDAPCVTNIEFALQNQADKELIVITPDNYVDGTYYFSINMTAADGSRFLGNSSWEFVAIHDHHFLHCTVNKEVGCSLSEMSRVFRYGKRNRYAYTVTFQVKADDNENPALVLDSYFMIVNDHWDKRRFVEEARSVTEKIRAAGVSCAVLFVNTLYRALRLTHRKSRRNILLMDETRDDISGNLKAIDDRMAERGLAKTWNVSYSFQTVVEKSLFSFSWLKLVFLISKQDVIVLDNYAPLFSVLKLDSSVKVVQVWHSGGGFKAVGYCRFGKQGSPYPVGSCHKAYTHVIVGSKHLVKVFEEVFGVERAAIYPIGMPRQDQFLDMQRVSRVKERLFEEYPDLESKSVVLFAPTYRGSSQKYASYDYNQLDLEKIHRYCVDTDSLFLVKMHPFVKEQIQIPTEYQDRILDFTSYRDLNELFYVADILITDYSSAYYEYAMLIRPILFYTFDREFYERSRGVWQSVKEAAPGRVCDTFEELMAALRNKDYDLYKVKQFVEENFDTYSTNVTDTVLDQIICAE